MGPNSHNGAPNTSHRRETSNYEITVVLPLNMTRLKFVVLGCLLAFGCGHSSTGADSVTKAKTMLAPEVVEEISTLVRSGFYDKARLSQVFLEEMYEPGELDDADVSAAIDAATQEWEAEKKQWPAVTDCDRLDRAFAAINNRGVIALQNAGYTQSDGYQDFREAYENHPSKSEIIGYCFYHGQDVERAVRGCGLFFAFGPTDPASEETEGPQIGNIVREELERVGLKLDWNGTFAKRMSVPNIVWQKR